MNDQDKILSINTFSNLKVYITVEKDKHLG